MNGIGIILLGAVIGQTPVLPSSGTDYGWQVENNQLTYILQISPELVEKRRLNPEPFTSDIPRELQGRVSRVAVVIGNVQLPRDPPLEKLEQLFPPELPKSQPDKGSLVPPENLNASRFKDVEPELHTISGTSSSLTATAPTSLNASASLSDDAEAAGFSATNLLRNNPAPTPNLLAQSNTSRFQSDARSPLTNSLPNTSNLSTQDRFGNDPKPALSQAAPTTPPTIPPSLSQQPSTLNNSSAGGLYSQAEQDRSRQYSQQNYSQPNSLSPSNQLTPYAGTGSAPSNMNPAPGYSSASQNSNTMNSMQTRTLPSGPNYAPNYPANSAAMMQNSNAAGSLPQSQTTTLPGMQPLPNSPISTFAAPPVRTASNPAYNYSSPANQYYSQAGSVQNQVAPGVDPYTQQPVNSVFPNTQSPSLASYNQQNVNAQSALPPQAAPQYPVPQTTTAETTRLASNTSSGNSFATNTFASGRDSERNLGFDDNGQDAKNRQEQEDKRKTDEGILRVFFLLSLVVNFYLGVIIRKLRTRYRSLLASSRSQNE